MAYKHGVYNTEQATSLTVPIQGSAGLQVIFGTAPIHLAKDPAAAVNTPKLVYSYKEAVEAVGYSDDFENFTLCQSISACFQVFNVAPIILVNVLDPNKAAHVTQNQAESCDVVDGVVLYDKKYVLLNTLAVKNGSATLVAGSDYEAAHEDNGSVAITLLSTAAKLAEERSLKHMVGNVLSSDCFYSAHPERTDLWRPMGVLCVEMEISALYANAAYAGKRALGILSISDVIGKNEELSPEDRQTKFTNMMELALDTVTSL